MGWSEYEPSSNPVAARENYCRQNDMVRCEACRLHRPVGEHVVRCSVSGKLRRSWTPRTCEHYWEA